MQRGSLANWLVIGALAALGLGFGAQAFAQEAQQTEPEVQGQNASDDSTAAAGTATGGNTSGFQAGPSANGSGEASTTQAGSNSATVTQSGSGESGDAVAGGQVTGSVGTAHVANQNSSSGSLATTGDVDIANDATVSMGPAASSDEGSAHASQVGDNKFVVSQVVSADSGDAVAGSQVTGIADADEATVHNQNSSTDAVALSGSATATNLLDGSGFLTLGVGPHALSLDGDLAQASQVGDNDAVIAQSAAAASGDGVAGSQVAGVAGAEDAAVSQQNSSEGSTGASGDAIAASIAFVSLGPTAFSEDLTAFSARAQAGQTGDNTVVADQRSGATTGDALGGSQVVGLVSAEEGRLEVRNQQASEADTAISGTSGAVNDFGATAGPAAVAFSSLLEVSGGGFVGTGGDAAAQSSQIGDNGSDVTQVAQSGSGDGVAGGQVTGVVGGSDVDVSNMNSATETLSASGDAFGTNAAFVAGGPLAVADASAIVLLTDPIDVDTCDVVDDSCTATASVVLDAILTGGIADAQSSQQGDNDAAIDQVLAVDSGDAVAGGQVTGVVAEGSEVNVQNMNASELSLATSGVADGLNIANIESGPTAGAFASASLEALTAIVVADAFCIDLIDPCTATANATIVVDVVGVGGSADASTAQTGDNASAIGQTVEVASGDATAGSQVAGVVSGDNSTINVEQQNSSDLDVAVSGVAAAANEAGVDDRIGGNATATAGAFVGVFDGAALATAGCAGPGCTATANPTVIVTATGIGGVADAQAAQVGDNDVSIGQAASASSGDAVAGSQVSGIVAGDGSDVTVRGQNSADVPVSVSGAAIATSGAIGLSSPLSLAGAGSGVIVALTAADGDAFCDGTGDPCTATATPVVSIDSVSAGGDAESRAAQSGDNTTDVVQTSEAASGDAVAGGQVSGVVSGDDSDLAVESQNSSDLAVATSGDAFSFTFAVVESGPRGFADASSGASVLIDLAAANADCFGPSCDATASASATVVTDSLGGIAQSSSARTGDSTVAVDQTAAVSSGDAVSGAQVTGLVAGDDSSLASKAQNDADTPIATSGSADVGTFTFVGAGAASGAFAAAFLDATDTIASGSATCVGDGCSALADSFVSVEATAGGGTASSSASQVGDNTASLDGHIAAASGDAVAGSQVSGAVAGDDSSVWVDGQNSSTDAVAASGSVSVASFSALELDATAFSDAGAFVFSPFNAAGSDAFCIGVRCTADAIATLDVVGTLTAGVADAASVQTGDNTGDVSQFVNASSGDAVAGGQVTGVVGGDATTTTVHGQNSADAPVASSGDVTAVVEASVIAGPQTGAFADAVALDAGFPNDASAAAGCIGTSCAADSDVSVAVDVIASAGDAGASSAQIGDNAASASQDTVASTGDAVSGAQVTGVAGGSGADVRVERQNSATEAVAATGSALVENIATLSSGPAAQATANAEVGVTADTIAVADCVGDDCTADATASTSLSASAAGGDAAARAAQTGDSDASLDQTASAATGDAVSGAQVAGVVTDGGSVWITNQSSSESSAAVSGDATAENTADVVSGPSASAEADADVIAIGDATALATCEDFVGGPDCTATDTEIDASDVSAADGTTDAHASQIGDSNADMAQSLTAESGDAVSGSQVSGVVGTDDAHVTGQNTDDLSVAFTGSADVLNTLDGFAGAQAVSSQGDAQSAQNGAVSGVARQVFELLTGDAVSGGQVVGLA